MDYNFLSPLLFVDDVKHILCFTAVFLLFHSMSRFSCSLTAVIN